MMALPDKIDNKEIDSCFDVRSRDPLKTINKIINIEIRINIFLLYECAFCIWTIRKQAYSKHKHDNIDIQIIGFMDRIVFREIQLFIIIIEKVMY